MGFFGPAVSDLESLSLQITEHRWYGLLEVLVYPQNDLVESDALIEQAFDGQVY